MSERDRLYFEASQRIEAWLLCRRAYEEEKGRSPGSNAASNPPSLEAYLSGFLTNGRRAAPGNGDRRFCAAVVVDDLTERLARIEPGSKEYALLERQRSHFARQYNVRL